MKGSCGPLVNNNFIIGTKNEIAFECSKTSNCKAFQHSERSRGGTLCKAEEIEISLVIDTQNVGDIQVCTPNSG